MWRPVKLLCTQTICKVTTGPNQTLYHTQTYGAFEQEFDLIFLQDYLFLNGTEWPLRLVSPIIDKPASVILR